MSHQDGSSHVHHFRHARVEEGEMVLGINKATPESITVKMELLEPVQQIDVYFKSNYSLDILTSVYFDTEN